MLPKPMQRVLCVLLIVVFMCTCGCAASTQNTPEPTNSESATPVKTPEETATPVVADAFPTPDFLFTIGERPLTRGGYAPHPLLTEAIYKSYVIIRAKYTGEAGRPLEFVELIMGDAQMADCIQTEVLNKFCDFDAAAYTKGEEYILFVRINPGVMSGPGTMFAITSEAYARVMPDEQLSFLGTNREEMQDVGLQTMDDLKRYIAMIKPLDENGSIEWLRAEPTGILENVVAFSTYVVRGTVLRIDTEYEDYTDITCKIKDVLKGTNERDELSIGIFKTDVEVGEECLFLVYKLTDDPAMNWRVHSAARDRKSVV